MNDDPRENPTRLGMAAVALLAAVCIVVAWPARQGEPVLDAELPLAADGGEAQWVDTGQPGEQMLVGGPMRGGPSRHEGGEAIAKRRATEAAELDALVQRSAVDVARARRAAAELEARLRDAPPGAGPLGLPVRSNGTTPAPER